MEKKVNQKRSLSNQENRIIKIKKIVYDIDNGKKTDGIQVKLKLQEVVEKFIFVTLCIQYCVIIKKQKKEYGKKYKQYVLEEERNKYGKLIKCKVVENNSKRNRVKKVFTRKDGAYSGKDIIKQPFRIIHHKLGIKCRFYDLRGSFATISLRNGYEIKDIVEELGHKRVETTQKYNISSTNNDKRDVSEKLEQAISSNAISKMIKFKE